MKTLQEREKVDELIYEHLHRFGENNLFRASLDHFRETGKASGSFRAALHALLHEYHKIEKEKEASQVKACPHPFTDVKDDGKVVCSVCKEEETERAFTVKEFSPQEIFEWLQKKRYQTERDEAGEYKMYFDIDFPRIINDFINDNIRFRKGTH